MTDADGLAFDAPTMIDAFARTVAAHGDAVALRDDHGPDATWADWDADVDRYVAGLAQRGVGRGTSVAFLLTNRREAYALDMAALHTGAAGFGIYATSSPEQIAHQLAVGDARVLVTESALAGPAREAAALAGTGTDVVCVDDPADLAALASDGGRRPDVEVGPDDVATLIFTSGTTGPPKAAELTHRNVMEECRISQAVVGLSARGSLISYLPVAHVADRVFAYYYAIVTGGAITFVGDPRTFVARLPEIRPRLLLSVPRIWDKLAAGMAAAGRAGSPEFDAALERSVEGLRAGTGAVDHPALAAVRDRFGFTDVSLAMSGSAPLSVATLRLLMGLGIPFSEGYGMSETTGIVVSNPIDAPRPGTIGVAAPGVEARLGEDGELLVRGGNVMRGYRGQPEETAAALDADGWMHTGDLATMDDDGYVTIVGRKKEIIINTAGKNMSPTLIEQAVGAESDLIGVVVCIGDGRPHNTALVVLDPDELAKLDPAPAVADAPADPRVQEIVAAAVQRGNARLSRPEQIRDFVILGETWAPGGELMTPTQKVRRAAVDAHYAGVIDGLYAVTG